MPRCLAFALLAAVLIRGSAFAAEPDPHPEGFQAGAIVLPEPLPDPLEPVNRAVWNVNYAVMRGVIQPTSRIYKMAVPRPLRQSIRRAAHNAGFPSRLINNLLQGRWEGARDETRRFLVNTTVGIGGLFDPATESGIPASPADFGQTFGTWGWEPKLFLMLPLAGPSTGRDALGAVADAAVNPLTYFEPYTYAMYGARYNNLSDIVDIYIRGSKSQMDEYWLVKYAWKFVRQNQVANFQIRGERDPATLQTLSSVFFSFRDPRFPEIGIADSARLPSGRSIPFTYWLQRGQAPVVYLVPGVGSHRLSGTTLALAELLYDNGYSVICVSSPFHAEFIRHAASTALPGYTPVDARDIHIALTEIQDRLDWLRPGRLGRRVLMGYSLGGYQTLFLAARESSHSPGLLTFDRYVAIHTPVSLLQAVETLDAYYHAPLEWPEEERAELIENTLLKVAELSTNTLAPHASLPFSAIESRFLIGLTFRVTLRDAIYTTQSLTNMGVLDHEIRRFRRGEIYREIIDYSYHDYLEEFLLPYYASRGIHFAAPEELARASDLRSHSDALIANEKVRIIQNENDILLGADELDWLRETFPSSRLVMFEQGGHLGNLADPDVQKTILDAVDGLKSPPPE